MIRTFNVLALGDSLIKAKSDDLAGWAKRFSERIASEENKLLKYYNKGDGGATSNDVLEQVRNYLNIESYWNIVIVGVGINDSRKRGDPPLRNEVELKTFRNNIKCICSSLLEKKKIGKAFFSGIIPVIESHTTPYKEDKYYFFNDALTYEYELERMVSKYHKITYLDFKRNWLKLPESKKIKLMPDGLHPNAQGHKYLSKLAIKLLESSI